MRLSQFSPEGPPHKNLFNLNLLARCKQLFDQTSNSEELNILQDLYARAKRFENLCQMAYTKQLKNNHKFKELLKIYFKAGSIPTSPILLKIEALSKEFSNLKNSNKTNQNLKKLTADLKNKIHLKKMT